MAEAGDLTPAVKVVPRAAYPTWLRGAILTCSVTHDVAILVAAVGAYQFTPPSVREALGPLEWVWIAMLVVGGVCGLLGGIFRWTPTELIGCTLMAFGMFTWAVSAASQPNPSPTTVSVTAAFFAGGFAVAWRAFGVLVGTFLRARG